MNDLEREIRETLRHHEGDAPTFDSSDARHAAAQTRRRQIVNVAGVGLGTLVIVIGLVVGLGGLVRADRSPTVLDTPSPSQTSVPTPGPNDQVIEGWPGGTRNSAGVYSWGSSYSYRTRISTPDGHEMKTIRSWDRVMHNGYRPGSGDVNILIKGEPGRLVPHRGQTTAMVAGHEASYRRLIGEDSPPGWDGLPSEEWLVDIQGTTVTILLIKEPRAEEAELAEAHEIIESMYVDPENDELGFRLVFTLRTNTWDSG